MGHLDLVVLLHLSGPALVGEEQIVLWRRKPMSAGVPSSAIVSAKLA